MSSTGGKGVWGKMRGIGVLACRAALRLRGLRGAWPPWYDALSHCAHAAWEP